MEIRVNTLTPELFLALYRSVGWEPPCIEQVQTALQNTLATFTCYDGDRSVGMARVIGDGGMSFYIKDFGSIQSGQGRREMPFDGTGTICEGVQALGVGSQP